MPFEFLSGIIIYRNMDVVVSSKTFLCVCKKYFFTCNLKSELTKLRRGHEADDHT